MAATIQKVSLIILGLAAFTVQSAAYAVGLQQCSSAPLQLGTKTIGRASYFAEDCQQQWNRQSIRVDFAYSHSIPDWAFKRAATHFLQRNLQNFSEKSELQRITQWYKAVKPGDLYSLSYQHNQQRLTLALNRQILGSLQSAQANQYFLIWFGSKPFNVKLKQQLLN
ncbi:chalcone isomerase family protein [Acinetobacter sp. CAAS 2-6]|uniref:chalcone isomerase family protein n=1 Tax=Acinetobacter sp. CAAS 2-6 TaxID=3016358 RepID=UPI002DD66DD0|nr:chalcone isomerase family protein [Acinetobacter sp. CAAS 2-6]